jgi:hypothetical protein
MMLLGLETTYYNNKSGAIIALREPLGDDRYGVKIDKIREANDLDFRTFSPT